MSKETFNVNLSPSQAMEIIENKLGAKLVDSQIYNLGNDKYIIVKTLEKQLSRTSIVIICDNTTEKTTVKAITTGNSSGLSAFDFGFGEEVINKIKKILKPYLENQKN